MLSLSDTHCCAIQEITGLSSYSNVEEAMADFCKKSLPSAIMYKTVVAKPNELYSFYLFTAGIGYVNPDYGCKFAELIEANQLGPVWASPRIVNRAFHPGCYNQVWIWMPDTAAVRAWWDKKKGGQL